MRRAVKSGASAAIDVARAALVERPRDRAEPVGGGDEVVGERIVEHLLEREGASWRAGDLCSDGVSAAADAMTATECNEQRCAVSFSCADYNRSSCSNPSSLISAYALRWLRKSPGFTLVAVASLAIGIGFNTALFAVVDALLFKPLPVAAPERLVDVFTSDSDRLGDRSAPRRIPTTSTCRRRTKSFDGIVGYSADVRGAEPRRPIAPRDGRDRHRQLLPELGVRRRARPHDSAGRRCRRRAARGDGVASLLDARARRRRRTPSAARVRIRGNAYTDRRRHAAPASAAWCRSCRPRCGFRCPRRSTSSRSACTTSCRRRPAPPRLDRRADRWMFMRGAPEAPGKTIEQARANLAAARCRASAAEHPVDEQGSPRRAEADQRRALSSGRRSDRACRLPPV